jgi:serine O-acetyltransferase
VIGSSVWITKSVSPKTIVVLEQPSLRVRGGGEDDSPLSDPLNYQI